MQDFAVRVTEKTYKHILKPLLFLHDAELVHNRMTAFGQLLGERVLIKNIMSGLYRFSHSTLQQTIAGIDFSNPVGLAAGFDYEGRLPGITPAIGFGFETIGTITNKSYKGNPLPRLGRLPKSKSLLVNKGFKNSGASVMIKRLENKQFFIPIGISIGRTNSAELGQKESITDIISTFQQFEVSSVKHSYYELNISCPNLFGTVDFYKPNHLRSLLQEIDALRLTRPVFIKMPIEKSDAEIHEMLRVIANYSPTGVIFGNLQKDRTNPALKNEEVKKFPRGNFSGKPTFARSNQLISLAYSAYNKRFVIIGCGGVFSAADAYTKISIGASLVQLITGMIFEGPQLIGQISYGLKQQLIQEGYTHISQVVGQRVKQH